MLIFLIRRTLVLVITLLIVSVLAFLIPYAGEGDPARKILRARVNDPALDQSQVDALTKELGLDRPIYEQYFEWLGNTMTGDFGFSYTSRVPVSEMVAPALSVSISLALAALLLALVFALPLGIVAATRRGGKIDNVITFLSQSAVSAPEYWVGPVLVLIFAKHLGWLPSGGWSGLAYIVMPALALSLRPMGYFTQVTRAAMTEVLAAPYITAARSRGLSFPKTLARHGMRNSMLPVMTLFSFWFAGLLGGSVVIEVIFNIPGMGRLLYTSVLNNDVPVIQGGMMWILTLAVVINTITDLLYGVLNPAIRVTHG
ncbi:ABC transporter permease [Nocardioides immobilis]|uniref:ABC transporter permease n=1 Tax=Nocardioides immobilis TaxID=2049295 RepID=A0A417Y4L6_9ACTN|nr:ABC transporter permease [Nocardioides immobilis]RHW27491.1 ABC transporter permease [Nocardioides immobilis]